MKAGLASPLKGRHRWLTNQSTVAVLLGLAIATAYLWQVLDFPDGSRLSFGLIVGAMAAAANFLGDGMEQRRLLTLRRLGEGLLPPTPEHLLSAAREVLRQPHVSFWLTLAFFAAGALLAGALWALVAGVPPTTALRLASIGLVLAPLTSTLSLLVSVPRARQVLRELVAAGLPVTTLYAGAPTHFVLRRQLMLFGAVAVFTPLTLVADLALTRLDTLLAALIAAPDLAASHALTQALLGARLAPVVALVVVVVVLVSACAWLSGSILGTPLRELAVETERLARGEHGAPRFIAGEYELLAAAGAVASMEAQLVDVLGRLGQAAGDLTGTTGTLAEGQQPAGEWALGQHLALDAASSTTGELARSAREIAANAARVSELARQTLSAALSGRNASEGFLGAMVEVREGNQAIADSVVRLNKRVQQVGRIIEFINGIADKSDLLALNAELEGNKAGEVGRGFSLVAAEMRRLAESVMQSTREIGGLIDEIRDATNAAVMATEAGVKATDAGAGLAQKVGAGLEHIVGYANQSADAMASISLATAQQEAGTEQLVGAMANIVRSTEASSSAARELVRAHDQLIVLAKDLETTVKQFEVHT